MRTQSLSKDDQRDSELRDDLVLANGSHSEDTPSVNQTEEANLGALEDSQLKDTQGLSDAATNVKKETTQGTNDESPKKTKKKKYKCKHCEKNFSSYSSLHVHVRIHTGHRPYSCNHCFKKFTHSSGLKRHVRCHTGEKPYPCPACPSAFADRGALKSHIRTHTGERPFVCDFCNKSFTQPSSLRVHKKTVHAHEFFDEKWLQIVHFLRYLDVFFSSNFRFLVDLSRIHCDVTLRKKKWKLVQETAPRLGSVRLISIS